MEVVVGTINSNTESSYSAAIQNLSTGSIIMGTKDDKIDKQVVKLEAKKGIENTLGALYWYDGTIVASESIIYGSVTQIEEKAKIVQNAGEGYLEPVEELDWIQNITTGKVYTDFQLAIDESNYQNTLQILQNYQQNQEVIITQEKDIILDLNGKTVQTYGSIKNQGTLKVIDTIGNGTMHSDIGTSIIQNTETIELNRRNIKLLWKKPELWNI